MVRWLGKNGKGARQPFDYDINVTCAKNSMRVSVSAERYEGCFNKTQKMRVGYDKENLRIYFVPSEEGFRVFRQVRGYRPYFQFSRSYIRGDAKCFLGFHNLEHDDIGYYIEGVR